MEHRMIKGHHTSIKFNDHYFWLSNYNYDNIVILPNLLKIRTQLQYLIRQ